MFGGFGIIIFIGLIFWAYKEKSRALPSALLSGYFAFNALFMLNINGNILFIGLYAFFAFTSGKRALQMRRSGYPW